MSKFCLYMPPLSSIGSYREMVDYAAEHNIKYLETLNILDLSTPDLQVAKDLKAYADSKGITFPCVSVGISLVDGDRKAAVETLKRYADIAKILGSPYLHHTIALNFSDPAYIAENFQLFYNRGLEAVREVFDYAASIGIRTIYEDQGFVFNGKVTFARFLKDVDRNVGVVADFGNIQFVDEDVEDFIAAVQDRIVHVHVKDYLVTPGGTREKLPGEYTSRGGNYLQGCLIGKGSVHTDLAFQALAAMGYKGYVALEGDPIGPDEEASFCKNLQTVEQYISRYL
ncbi:MAG: sugar phosphate isomerase/epimerase [Oscillospiraceae bacterium]|nr:sugar phosphate isomerase/epimerase [Oscillospiraceae bacterium]